MGIAQVLLLLSCSVLLLDYPVGITAVGRDGDVIRSFEKLSSNKSGSSSNTRLNRAIQNTYLGKVARRVENYYATYNLRPVASYPEWLISGAHRLNIPEENLAFYIVNKQMNRLDFNNIRDADPVYETENQIIYLNDIRNAAQRKNR